MIVLNFCQVSGSLGSFTQSYAKRDLLLEMMEKSKSGSGWSGMNSHWNKLVTSEGSMDKTSAWRNF